MPFTYRQIYCKSNTFDRHLPAKRPVLSAFFLQLCQEVTYFVHKHCLII